MWLKSNFMSLWAIHFTFYTLYVCRSFLAFAMDTIWFDIGAFDHVKYFWFLFSLQKFDIAVIEHFCRTLHDIVQVSTFQQSSSLNFPFRRISFIIVDCLPIIKYFGMDMRAAIFRWMMSREKIHTEFTICHNRHFFPVSRNFLVSLYDND